MYVWTIQYQFCIIKNIFEYVGNKLKKMSYFILEYIFLVFFFYFDLISNRLDQNQICTSNAINNTNKVSINNHTSSKINYFISACKPSSSVASFC